VPDPEEDPLLKKAIEIIRKDERASISMLQRKLAVGYTRAARMIDRLEELEIIGKPESGSGVRPVLDFGDEEISRQGHASLTYDTRGRKFYIQHGEGTNLTYLGDAPVLQPHEIKGREIIGIGKTRLMFMPFCGPEFEWEG